MFVVILVGPFYYEENYLYKDPTSMIKYILKIVVFLNLKENVLSKKQERCKFIFR